VDTLVSEGLITASAGQWEAKEGIEQAVARVPESLQQEIEQRLEEGVVQIRQGLAAWQALGAATGRPYWLALLAEAYGRLGQIEDGLAVVAGALEAVQKTEQRPVEAKLYRLKDELYLQSRQVEDKSKTSQDKSEVPSPESEAEECFHTAIEIARKQQAKSLELRAVMSLSRLWQSQGKREEARKMLAEVYGWFTEGFDTVDLKAARALLERLEGQAKVTFTEKCESREKQSARTKHRSDR